MARWIELRTSNTAQADEAVAQTVRRFRVWDAVGLQIALLPQTIIDSVSGFALPSYNDGHPSVPSLLFLDSYRVNPDGSTWLVDAVYSTNGSGRLPQTPPNPADSDFPEFSASFQSEVDNIPMNVPAEVRVDSPGGVPEIVPGRAVIEQAYENNYIRLRVRRRISVSQIGTVLRVVEDQHRKLHKVRTIWAPPGSPETFWLFEGADINPIDVSFYEVMYSWRSDPGVPDLGTQELADLDVFAPVFSNPPNHPGLWSRPPFQSVMWIPIPGQTDQIKEVAVKRYDIDEMGWTQLPGL